MRLKEIHFIYGIYVAIAIMAVVVGCEKQYSVGPPELKERCETLSRKLDEAKAKLAAQQVSSWTVESWLIEDGKVRDVRIRTSDGDSFRLIWLSVGKKIVIGKWFTHGKSAQKIPVAKLKEAWLDGEKGVYLLDAHSKTFLEFVLDLTANGIGLEIS